MKKTIFKKHWVIFSIICINLLFAFNLYAQDLIIRKNNQAEKGRIVEVTLDSVKYNPINESDDNKRSISKEEVLIIVYDDGNYESFYLHDKEVSEISKKGKYGRRAIRQLGYIPLYSENTSGYSNASRYGINYSVGHIKDNRPLGFLFELGINVFTEGYFDGEEKVLDNYNMMMTVLFGAMVKIYKSNKFLLYGKVAGGGVANVSLLKEPEEFFSYNDYKLDYNYNLALGFNYKLGRKFGLYAEGGLSRIQMLQAGISFMID